MSEPPQDRLRSEIAQQEARLKALEAERAEVETQLAEFRGHLKEAERPRGPLPVVPACPLCHAGTLVVIAVLRRQPQVPP